ARNRQASNDAENNPAAHQAQPHADHQAKHVALLRSQRHANADFVRAPRGGVGKNTVDTDGDQHKADGAEDAHEKEAESWTGVGKAGDETLQSAREGERDVAVGGPYFVADRVHQGHRFGTGAHQKAASAGTGHGVRHPDFGPHRILQTTVFDVGDNTDDFEPGVDELVGKLLELRDVDALAQGIFVAEIFV